MKIRSQLPLLVFVLLSLSTCNIGPASLQNTPPSLPATKPISTSLPPANPGSSDALIAESTILPPTPTASENTISPTISTPLPLPHYVISATLDYWQHILMVDQTITYTNRTTDPLTNLIILAEPLYYPGTFRLKSMKWQDGKEVENQSWENSQLNLPLLQPLLPGNQMTLSFSYDLQLPSPTPAEGVRPIPFGYTARQTNLVDWYPYIPPYIPGKGWLAHPASFYGEHLVYDLSDFDVNIQVLGTGSGEQPLTIAASTSDTVNGLWHRYQFNQARNFVLSVSHVYKVITTTVGDITVIGYYFPFHPKAGKAVLQVTAESLALFNKIFSPYPHKVLSVVEADFLDGMEYDGLYFLSNGFYNLYSGKTADYLTTIAAHETAHQWWYALVGNDQAMEPWLDEALCTYSERLYFENIHPNDLDWWWAYRVNYYEPSGWVNTTIYNPEGKTDAYRSYRDAVYLNGAVFLEKLRQDIGNTAFFGFLHDYLTTSTHQIATSQSFFNLLQKYSTSDLTELRNMYFKP